MDGSDGRGGRRSPQGPGRSLPLELRAAVDPPERQGQRAQLLVADQEAGTGGGDEAGRQGRGWVEDRHVPQLLGPQLNFRKLLSLFQSFRNRAWC
jgi:hypothetical protein